MPVIWPRRSWPSGPVKLAMSAPLTEAGSMASDMVSMIEASGARCVAGFESVTWGGIKSMVKLPLAAALPWPSWPRSSDHGVLIGGHSARMDIS